jgi:predicted 2-oxoglutarate/Fe(II)-dependent dioxygenase YbiX
MSCKLSLPCAGDASKFALVMEEVFSTDECGAMIANTESKGYEKALLNIGEGKEFFDPSIRKSSRCILDSVDQASVIWKRIKQHRPVTLTCSGEQWIAVGLNERLRFLRYDHGDFFVAHCDSAYERENGERSFVTLLLYLNEEFECGETTFPDFDSDAIVRVQPKTGRVLVFEHDIYHSGAKVTEGVKYIVRTDVMYRRSEQVSS